MKSINLKSFCFRFESGTVRVLAEDIAAALAIAAATKEQQDWSSLLDITEQASSYYRTRY